MTTTPNKPLILLTGATGYVGGRLLKALHAAGYPVRCVARRPEFLTPRVRPDTEIVKGDCLDAALLPPACAGVHTPYYLVHYMGSTGDFTVYVGGSTGWQPVGGRFIEFRPDGEIVHSYTAGAPYYTDSHELLLSVTAGTVSAAHLYGYELRALDLTALGGRPDQLVAGHTLLRQSGSGATEFLWNAWDHLSIADWVFIPPDLASYPTIDFDHPNSLAIDRDGNYVVSFAGLGEIACIDAVTGQLLWRFGGRHNQFTILGDPLGGFGFQHDVRVLQNGDLLFFDNGLAHAPPQSRAVQYHLDLSAMTATLTWEYRHDPPIFAPFVGSVQRFQDGNTLVGFGPAAIMTEVTPTGQVLWEGRLTVNGQPVPYFYRARRIASLYRYQPP